MNIRSFNRNKDNLLHLLADLEENGVIIHVIGLCETFLTPTSQDLADIENYSAIHKTRDGKLGGGTTLLIHDSVKLVRVLDTPFGSCFESTTAEVKFRNKSILVSEFYRPPNSDNNIFNEMLQQYLSIVKGFDLCFLCSDHNYNFLNSGAHKEIMNFFDYLLNEDLIPYILKPTRITHKSSTLIDNIFVKSKAIMPNNSFVIVDGMSDHYPCLLSYSLKISSSHDAPDLVIERRKLNDTALLKIQQSLLFHDWTGIVDMTVDRSYEYLIAVITNAMDKHAPVKKTVIKADYKFAQPWISVQLLKYNRKCRALCNKARHMGLVADHDKYKTYRNTLNQLKLHQKRTHYQEVFTKVGKNSKLLWNVINGVLKNCNNKMETVELLYDGHLLTDKKQICNAFNEHFVKIGSRVQSSITNTDTADLCSNIHRAGKEMKFSPVTEGEICKIVNKMKNKESRGLDDISNALLKKLVAVLKQPLCVIFNKSLNIGTFPDLMKIAKVLPLFKHGEKQIPDNYRPISLLPVISKVLEKIMYTQMVSHLEETNALYARQYGFRKNSSTCDVVTNLVGEILNAFEDNRMVLAVFIDLKKAFDTVSHCHIFSKLETLGVRGTELKWFRSYLENRRQCVELHSMRSEMKRLPTGVPQGSLLGVLLFKIDINDVFKSLKQSMSILYADDTTLFITGKSLHFLRVKMQHDLLLLSKWLSTNKLKLNISKTKCMLFHKEGLTPDVELEVDGETVQMVKKFMFLGVVLDGSLSFESHFEMLHNKLQRSAFVIRKLSHIFPKSCMPTLYFASYHSHLSYCLLVWFPLLSKKLQNLLSTVQKRIVRNVCNIKPISHCMKLFKEKRILTVVDLVKVSNCKLIHRILNGTCPKPISHFFRMNYGTRSMNVVVPKHSLTKLNKSFLCKSVIDWCSVRTDIKKTTNTKQFSIKLKKDLLTNY